MLHMIRETPEANMYETQCANRPGACSDGDEEYRVVLALLRAQMEHIVQIIVAMPPVHRKEPNYETHSGQTGCMVHVTHVSRDT